MSLQLRLLSRGLAWIVRPRLRHIRSVQAARVSFERTARLAFRVPGLVHYSPDNFEGAASEQGGLWSISAGSAARSAILYFHGGGYIAGNPFTHRVITGRLARQARVRVFAPDYRLAPETRYPGALQDAEAAFTHLLKRGYRPGDIVVGGDSAGGGLALALLARLCAAGQAPAGVFVFSPWTDLALTGDSLERNRERDSILLPSRITEMRDYYSGGADPFDPGMSPLYADFPGCPPVLIQVSDSEILADDAFRMAEALKGNGADVEVQTWSDAPHVWQVLDGWVPEAREALEKTAAFVRRALGRSLQPSGN